MMLIGLLLGASVSSATLPALLPGSSSPIGSALSSGAPVLQPPLGQSPLAVSCLLNLTQHLLWACSLSHSLHGPCHCHCNHHLAHPGWVDTINHHLHLAACVSLNPGTAGLGSHTPVRPFDEPSP